MKNYDNLLEEWKHKILRMWEIRRPGQYTPYEMDQRYEDESLYKSIYCEHIKIIDAYVLPDNDILIAYITIEDVEDYISAQENNYADKIITYKKLSEVDICFYDCDQSIEFWEERA